MSHLEKSDAVIHGNIGTATIPTLTNTFIRLFADLKKQLGNLIFLFASALLLTACGGGTTTTVTATPPAAPTAIASTGGNGLATIGWKAVTGATSYNVYYGTSAGVTTASATKVTGITSTSTTISSLTNATPYFFDVTAVNAGSESAKSSEVSVTPASNNAGLLWSLADLTANAADPNLVIIDIRNSGAAAGAYGAGHITGAINIPTATFDSPIGSTALNPALAAIVLGDAGVSKTSKILLYGADASSAGRVFWILEYLGAKDVHILNGGYTAWLAVPNTAQTTTNYLTATTFSATEESIKLATKADVLAHYADTTNYSIVDSRNYDDASGATANGNYVTLHIPNAVSILTQHFFDPASPFNVLPLTSAALTTPTPGSGCTLDITASAIVAGAGGAITAATVNVAGAGTGYSVGSILMVEGGNHSALFRVASVDVTGGVTGVTLVTGGALYVTGLASATRDYSSLANVLSANGITAGKTIIAHCYVGYRSGFEYFIFRLLGFNVSNYDGSWTEWYADTTPLPTTAGPLP